MKGRSESTSRIRINGAIERSPAGNQDQRIQIALHRYPPLHLIAGEQEVDRPV